jgi:hypothetical protein
MKKYLLTFVAIILTIQGKMYSQTDVVQFPTFAESPSSENVLVVYNNNLEMSVNIMLHYMDVRNIPFSTHKVPIILDDPVNYGVEFVQGDQVIKGPGINCWTYVKEVIADTVEHHLNTTYYNGQLLKDLIRYVVICPGIPFKIWDINSPALHHAHWFRLMHYYAI